MQLSAYLGRQNVGHSSEMGLHATGDQVKVMVIEDTGGQVELVGLILWRGWAHCLEIISKIKLGEQLS